MGKSSMKEVRISVNGHPSILGNIHTHQFSATFTLCLDPCSDKCSMLSANPSNEGSQEGNPHGFLDLDGFGVDNLSSNDLNDANPMSYTILKKCGVCLSNWA